MSDNGDQNPLEDLFVDKQEINRELLVNALDGVIGIDKETGEPVFQSQYHKLNNLEKITSYLLFRLALRELGLISDDEVGMTSSELAEILSVSDSTIRVYASRKVDFIEQDNSHGGYYIPGRCIREAVNFIGGGEDTANE